MSAPKTYLRNAIVVAVAFISFACDESLVVENTAASITAVGPVELADPPSAEEPATQLRISYGIRDLEMDDEDLDFIVCEWSCDGDDCTTAECGAPVQGTGGDGATRVPTVPASLDDDSASHIFVWRFSCGRYVRGSLVDSRPDQQYVVGITPVDSDHEPVFSAPFVFGDLGVAEIPACE